MAEKNFLDLIFYSGLLTIQNLTGLPVARKSELDEFYQEINTHLRPIIEERLMQKTGVRYLKQCQAELDIIDFDLFDPPKWSDAWSETSQIEYGLKTMELLFTCLEKFNINEKDGVKVQKLRQLQSEMRRELERLRKG